MSLELRIQRIIGLAKRQFVLEDHNIHGFGHWENVERNGIKLSSQPGVDIVVVRLFAYLHDCKRLDDKQDPEHGDRSAEYSKLLRDRKQLDFLTEEQFKQLYTACLLHHKGVVERNDMTIGACFDADRLELTRCGYIPDPELMSTPMGIEIAKQM